VTAQRFILGRGLLRQFVWYSPYVELSFLGLGFLVL
jgi:hypothetical protein